jgi:hypothetical protein
MKSWTVALVVAATVGTFAGQAGIQTPSKTIWGDGTMPCSQWLAAAERSGPDTARVSWTLGYLSGVASTGTAVRPVSDVYVLGWITSHCEKNQVISTSTVATATQALTAFLAAPSQ